MYKNFKKKFLKGGSPASSGKTKIPEPPVNQLENLSLDERVKRCWSIINQQSRNESAPWNRQTDGASSIWKTVRVFVSSTFTDFHSEREILVKQVFPSLREWCEERKLNLVECDLRWGVPKDSNTRTTICTCLEELDRCHEENNGQPFFINMLSARYGWIPSMSDVPDDIKEKYSWVPDTSITTMEILHGAYRSKNPNSAFFLRDPGFLKDIPDEQRGKFIDEDPLAVQQLEVLKQQLHSRFPSQVYNYNALVAGFDESTGRKKVKLAELQGFADNVLSFLKAAIEKTYPRQYQLDHDLAEDDQENIAHEKLMQLQSQFLLGRDQEISTLMNFINGKETRLPRLMYDKATSNDPAYVERSAKDVRGWFDCEDTDTPLMCVSGKPGIGKSAVLATFARKAKDEGHNVLYHYIGSTQSSSSLHKMYQRLIKFVARDLNDPKLKDMDSKTTQDLSTLWKDGLKEARTAGRKLVLVVDELAELDTKGERHHLAWLPAAFYQGMYVVTSVNDRHLNTLDRIKVRQPLNLELGLVDLKTRKAIAAHYLGAYNKKLDPEQMKLLTEHDGAAMPIWLNIACEDLRVFGDFATLTQKVKNLPQTLEGLISQILDRLVAEDESECLAKLLCLIECAMFGLVEKEIPNLLGNPAENQPAPLMTWATLRLVLKPYLRFVNLFTFSGPAVKVGFFHEEFSQAVRAKFMNSPAEVKKWHLFLADYYKNYSSDRGFLIQDYPFHLIEAGERNRLAKFFKSDRDSMRTPAWIKQQYMEGVRCRNNAGPNWPGSEKYMLCSMCNGQMGNLSPTHPARDSCTVCGEWVPSSRPGSEAFLCTQHKKMGVPGTEHCGLCKRPLQGIFDKGKSQAKVCTRCGFGIPRCCAIIV